MSLRNERQFYDKAKVSAETGETEVWDHVIFPNAIRKRQIELILTLTEEVKPKLILDFGCGAGWLSAILTSKGYCVVGIDLSSSLIEIAANLPAAKSNLCVGDCMNLPFKDGVFDLIIGIAILHHLNPEKGLTECSRVTTKDAIALFMEPNKLNPIAAFGRKILKGIHTKGENPFYPWELTKTLSKGGWVVEKTFYLFPFSFGLAYLLGRTKWRSNSGFKIVISAIRGLERLIEAIPLINRLSWVLGVIATKKARTALYLNQPSIGSNWDTPA